MWKCVCVCVWMCVCVCVGEHDEARFPSVAVKMLWTSLSSRVCVGVGVGTRGSLYLNMVQDNMAHSALCLTHFSLLTRRIRHTHSLAHTHTHTPTHLRMPNTMEQYTRGALIILSMLAGTIPTWSRTT